MKSIDNGGCAFGLICAMTCNAVSVCREKRRGTQRQEGGGEDLGFASEDCFGVGERRKAKGL